MRFFVWLLIGLGLSLVACSGQIPPPSPPTFNRPQRVAFACFDTAGTKLYPLDTCRPQSTTTTAASPYSLNALVTQSDRGEVADVDLTTMQVIDARQDIPGYTFVPAGELPGPIVVPPNHPALMYVANAGSRDISVINTLDVRHLPVRTNVVDVRVPVRTNSNEGAQPPFDMLLSPDEDALFVTAPDAGWLLRMPIQRCGTPAEPGCREGQIDSAHVVRVPLERSLAKASFDEAASGNADEPYTLVCDSTSLLPMSTVMTALSGPPSGQTPKPAGLTIDAFCRPGETSCKRRLLVADKNLPIVHAVDIDALAQGNVDDSILTPIVTGVPTERVAVTPRVPVDLGDNDHETQYVYAISQADGSVVVTENGRPINVASDPSRRPDRLDVGSSLTTGAPVAISIEVLTPDFDVTRPSQQWLEPNNPAIDNVWACGDASYTTRTSNRLRGVFLAVGLTDGTVRVIDIHDLELAHCRSCDATSVIYDPYPVRRHRPHINVVYVPPATGEAAAPVLTPTVAPQFEIGTSVIYVNSDGTTNDPRVAGLACITCPAREAASFPAFAESAVGGTDTGRASPAADGGVAGDIQNFCGAGEGRVCTISDPWIDPITWIAYREGLIPGARGGLGRFVDATSDDNRSGSLEFAGEAHFCDSGVLGDDDIGDVTGDKNPDGDQLEITSVLPDVNVAAAAGVTGRTRSDCEALVAARDDLDDPHPIGFRIQQAYGDRLVLDGSALIDQSPNVKTHVDYAFVRQCFLSTLLTYQVHARQSYIVLSNNGPGFQHRVVTDTTSNRCVIDTKQDPKHNGRAYDQVLFDNGFVSFKVGRAPTVNDSVLRLVGTSNVPKLFLDATAVSGGIAHGVLPVQLKYSDVDQTLYVVDITTRGLIPAPLAAFPSAVLTSYQ